MRPNAEDLPVPTQVSEYGPDRASSASHGEQQISSYPFATGIPHVYLPPHHADTTSHQYPPDMNFIHDQANTVTGYPESSQRTSIHSHAFSSAYSRGSEGQFDDERGSSTTYATLGDPELNDTSLGIPSTMRRQPPLTQPDAYQYHTNPPGVSTSHHRRVTDQHSLANTGSDSPLDHFAYYDSLRPPGMMAQRRVSPEAPNPHLRFDSPPLYPGDFAGGSGYLPYADPDLKGSQHASSLIHPSYPASIPMRNNSDWSSASPSSAFEAQDHVQPLYSSSSRTTSGTPTAYNLPGPAELLGLNHGPDFTTPLSSEPTSSTSVVKKKKSKMHECEVCGKMFPRPSGLKTHMNTHNNLKPFPCGFPGCTRTFTVRSNAKRHLRTHGVDTIPAGVPLSTAVPYTVGFSTPTVMPADTDASHEMSKLPYKLRWMPPSLSTRTNADSLSSLSDGDSDSDDLDEDPAATNVDWRSALSIPLRAVIPSSYTINSCTRFEERNSYLDASLYPYHPSQFRMLPGPFVPIPLVSES
ncbi:hypothetical protein Hypma_014159 [Hypsizygus marmoreus]|uniref:C2H2-type domain-containing protein n=1 Tax=Hypsizygus marmoreus TaxID=39966 RepID=A0A369KG94_HYPMA|nr:hypothetical protein Hypma_014159 [Hypsizygus marmoreus]